jgi:hypothetical protein
MQEASMHALALTITPTRDGWAVGLTDGSELARFHGIGAKRRAMRYLTSYIHG